jgi:hypothetical protein
MGLKRYTEKARFVDDIRQIAATHDCCVFVAEDDVDATYIAEKNVAPPPLALVDQAMDTPSINERLMAAYGKRGGSRGKPVIFLGIATERAKALAISVAADAGTRPDSNFLDIAKALGEKVGGARKRILQIARGDLKGRRSLLEIDAGPKDPRGFRAIEHLTRPRSLATWKADQFRPLTQEETNALVANAGWDAARDGVPVAFVLEAARDTGGGEAVDIAIAAGFAPEAAAGGEGAVRAAHGASLAAVPNNGATIAQYLMTVKNELHESTGPQVKRLIAVVQAGETETFLSNAQRQPSEPLAASPFLWSR